MYILRPLLFSLFLCLCGLTNLQAQTPAARIAQPSKIDELLRLLEDEDVRVWLERKQDALSEPRDNEAVWFIEEWEARSRARFNALLAAVPRVGDELSRVVSAIRQEARSSGLVPAALMFVIIAGIAVSTEWIFRRSLPEALPRGQAYTEILTLSIFTASVAIFFFLFTWPPLMRVVLLYSLVALIAWRLATALLRIALAASIVSARSYSRTQIFVALLAATMAFSAICERLAVAADVRSALAIGLSIPLVVIAVAMIWRERSSDVGSLQGRVSRAMGISGAVVLWLLWCGDFLALFWLGMMLALVPRALSIADSLTLSPSRSSLPDAKSVLLVRGTRAIILIAAVDWVAFVWRHNFPFVSGEVTLIRTIIAGAFNSVVILLIIDLVWQLAKAYITSKLSDVGDEGTSNALARESRLRTLLPVFRNALAAALLCVAGLTVLSEMGVKIGPLVAGAGVVGVAIGFGSQTLVKDVVSGIFYLLDDAFRVGEYIEAGNYTGVVESFSLRSVRLRHHRGPIFTVPFGSLGAIKNASRDWSVDKFRIRVPFKTDVDKVRKLIKEIGAQLQADPQLGSLFIEPLKLKGVEQIGEYGIELGIAFTCKPGEQTVIRRKAYAMLMQAFHDNGIDFAQPVVQVSGDEKETAAATLAVRQRPGKTVTPDTV
ncbi:mechanosensitive ion channel family protein [Ensifer adhaerens]|uniref:mechanosensitive ion channel family protein n=1 Tax=Ensifer TaxID=106591 RepID=UPI0013AF13C3|nr:MULTISPECIES: mechanosensitive ion channel family protein [unclassified Ensifer]MBD9498402.1 mechanosensitive ion channel family protein [Ensifer sp. ENS01]MBD9572776.1 mechanosensitive ion channel family protein [Ensifer sp. ENS08]